MDRSVSRPKNVVLLYVTGGSNEDCFTNGLIGEISYDAAHNSHLADVCGIIGLYVEDNRDIGARRFMRYRQCPDCRNIINRGEMLTQKVLRCNFCQKPVPEPITPEWLWFVDTDISFVEYGILDKMLESAAPVERPILSALYFGYMDGKTLGPVWYGRETDGRIAHLTNFKSGLNKLGVCGMGCCLIHRSVFEKFGTKYSKTGYLYFGRDRAPWMPLADVNNDICGFGEDNCFCHRAGTLDIPIYGNADIQVRHMKKRLESFDTFLDSFKQKEVTADGKRVITRAKRQDRGISRATDRMWEQPSEEGYSWRFLGMEEPNDAGPSGATSPGRDLGPGDPSTSIPG